MPSENRSDILIFGAGPAGLSAGIWLARFLYDVVVIDSGDPRNWQTQEIHGFLGAERARPREIRHLGRQACRRYGVTLVDQHATTVEQIDTDDFRVHTDQEEIFRATRVLIATGIQDNWPQIPGLQECYGTTVHTCPNCDGFESRGTPTAVIGSRKNAAIVALALKTWTDQILICTNGQTPRIDEPTEQALERMEIEINDSPIAYLDGRDRLLRAIRFENGDVAVCEHLFIAMGQHARDNDVSVQLGCKHDDIGRVMVDSFHRTSVENVFAAGDITPGAQLAIRAAAGGAEAALSIHHSLIPEERRVHRRC